MNIGKIEYLKRINQVSAQNNCIFAVCMEWKKNNKNPLGQMIEFNRYQTRDEKEKNLMP